MSDGLSPKARAFLRSVERADEPTRADFDRVRAGVKEQLAASIAVGMAAVMTAKAADAASVSATTEATPGIAATTTTASVAAPTAVAASGAGAALVLKVAAAILVVGSVAGGTTALVKHVRANDLPQSPTPVVNAPARSGGSGGVRAQQEPPPAPVAAAPDPIQPPATTSEPAPLPAPRRAVAHTQRAPAQASASAAPPPSPLDVEIALLRDARSALHAGDAARALSLLDQHDQLYPAGVLNEDAAAERIYALCALDQSSQARVLADRFFATHPSSPHAPSVRSSCAAR